MRFFVLILLTTIFTGGTCAATSPQKSETKKASGCHADAEWTEPATPLHIHGNTWFVGTCGLSSILIISPQGHIVIDGDVPEDAPLIEASIRQLGFRIEDVRYILNSHEHSDHAGGIAQLQRDSHAVVAARAPAAAALEHGKGDRSDPQFLSGKPYPASANVRRIADGETITLGSNTLTAHATSGHTPGSTTWTWNSCEKQQCVEIVYADSLSPISDDVFRYSDDASHPGYLANFRKSIALIAALPCDILLTPHPDASDLWNRLGPNAKTALIDAQGCRRYSANAEKNLEARIQTEQKGKAP
jgi:metallo-beta-lactamase class B